MTAANDNAETGEEKLIARYFRPIATHPGALALSDDAAFITPPAGHDIVLKTDAIIGGVHFFPDDPADAVARKALRVNLSDLAAKGAKPLGFLLALALPKEIGPDWLAAFAEGLGEDARSFDCPLFGGDTDRTPGPVTISIAAFGAVPHGAMVRRGGARPGDLVFVTGSIGDGVLGLRLCRATSAAKNLALDSKQSAYLVDRYMIPQPRLGLAEALRAHASAAMDVSDGLAGDFAKLCRTSGISAEVDASRIPFSPAAQAALAAEPPLLTDMLTGGDDYEILCTAPADRAASFMQAARDSGTALSEIGRIVAGDGPPKFLEFSGPADDLCPNLLQPFLIAAIASPQRGTPMRQPEAERHNEPKAANPDASKGGLKGGLAWGVAGSAREIARRRKFPTVDDMRRTAQRRVPGFGFEYVDGGAGLDRGVLRNAQALDAVEIVARYGVEQMDPPIEVMLFGRKYSAPLGVAPMGLPGLIWPGAEIHLAHAAQRARIPYTAATVGGVALERLGALAPDVLWFQLYRLPGNDHAAGFDLVRRARDAGAHVLVLTLDVPARMKRPRELRNGLLVPFKLSARMVYEAATSPGWLMALMRHGQPTFANLAKYAENNARGEIAGFTQREVRGAFTWEEVARLRDAWDGPLTVKGILHPGDAEKAVSLGVDGIQVSNHGGRQLEGAPPSIDVLPAVAAAAGSKATILFDGGVRSGLDVVRALALGASAALAGRAFLYSLGALGEEGPAYLIEMLSEEIRSTLRQLGAVSLDAARMLTVRHPGAMGFS